MMRFYIYTYTLIIDVHAWEWIEQLKQTTPEHLREFFKIYYLREYDDIIFTINKSI